MGVLDVVDGVDVGLRLGQIEIEVHHGIRRAADEEEADRVGADLIQDFAQAHEGAGSLAHGHWLPVAEQVHELVDQHHQARLVDAQRPHHALHPRHVALMVGTPDVDGQVVVSVDQLVVVVGNIRREVGRQAVAAHEDVVLVIAQGRGREPGGAFSVDDEPALAQRSEGALDLAAVEE